MHFLGARSVRHLTQWQYTLQENGLAPATATATNRNITVTPSVTRRYYLQITPTNGFGPGCGDNTSILVRVLPALTPPLVSRNGNTLISSAATGNQWFYNNQVGAGTASPTIAAINNGSYAVAASVVTGAVGRTSATIALTVLATQHARHKPEHGPHPPMAASPWPSPATAYPSS